MTELVEGDRCARQGEGRNSCRRSHLWERRGYAPDFEGPQTITLALNLRLDSNLGTLVVRAQMTTSNGVFVFDSSVIDGMVQYGGGPGVANLPALANHALAGGDTGGLSLATISAAVDSINQAVDECATLDDCQ